jgi:hypothetical protein
MMRTSLPLLLLACSISGALSQTRVLDTFDELSGWRALPSEGAALTLSSAPGKSGNAMVMDFDLSRASGYVIARKDFPLDLPPDYQFAFDIRGDLPTNNFEFKIIDDRENVFWIKKLNSEYPKTWTTRHIWKQQLTFAWGPTHPTEMRRLRAVEFVVSCGSGGKGRVYIDNFRLDSVDQSSEGRARPEAAVSSSLDGLQPGFDAAGNRLGAWECAATQALESLTLSFHRFRAVGGLVIDWDSAAYASAYDVQFSDDGAQWTTAYSVRHGNGGRDYVPLPEGQGKFLRILLSAGPGRRYRIRSIELKDAGFGASPNSYYKSIAADAGPGCFPLFLSDKQSYWTVVGADNDVKEALINEQGQVEVDRQQFSLEPFLFIDGKLVTWHDVSTECALLDNYLPIPTVRWKYGDICELGVSAVAAPPAGRSLLGLRYSITARRPGHDIRFYLAIRPFQVNPPWQGLNFDGGTARIDSILNDRWAIRVNGKTVIPMTNPTAFGAAEFDQGDITEYLKRGTIPSGQEVRDHAGHASGVLQYDIPGEPDRPYDVIVAVPFYEWNMKSPVPNMGPGASYYYRLMTGTVASEWGQLLSKYTISGPVQAAEVLNTMKSQLAYILINKDGPGTQPGSRTYERSWIRDGALTCYALLQAGNLEEVRQYLDWYAGFQFPSGKIPCVVDGRGGDAINEHDSNGEFLFAVRSYFRFSRDTTWLRGKIRAVELAVAYLDSLRSLRSTDEFRNGSPEKRALYGLVPESISHEGYWEVPRHSYWDDFFVLRGYKDAAAIAAALGDRDRASAWGKARDEFRGNLYASMKLAMKNAGIDYIPGCAELGDFDATSTTIGIVPGGELGNIPEPALHNTFDRYYAFIKKRMTDTTWTNYTPYEMRAIGSFVLLGQKDRAAEALAFFMNDRRPAGWNHWAEVVWRNRETPKYIGDMPHTWCGSDFMRSVFTMFAYERERDGALVLAAGIPDGWIKDPAGVGVRGLRSPAGTVNYRLSAKGATVTADVQAGLDTRGFRVVMTSPVSGRLASVRLNGKKIAVPANGEVALPSLPARIDFTYRQ